MSVNLSSGATIIYPQLMKLIVLALVLTTSNSVLIAQTDAVSLTVNSKSNTEVTGHLSIIDTESVSMTFSDLMLLFSLEIDVSEHVLCTTQSFTVGEPLQFIRPSGKWIAIAKTKNNFGHVLVSEDNLGEVELNLAPMNVIAVTVKDSSGNLLAGIPVSLHFVEQNIYSGLVRGRTNVLGVARLFISKKNQQSNGGDVCYVSIDSVADTSIESKRVALSENMDVIELSGAQEGKDLEIILSNFCPEISAEGPLVSLLNTRSGKMSFANYENGIFVIPSIVASDNLELKVDFGSSDHAENLHLDWDTVKLIDEKWSFSHSLSNEHQALLVSVLNAEEGILSYINMDVYFFDNRGEEIYWISMVSSLDNRFSMYVPSTVLAEYERIEFKHADKHHVVMFSDEMTAINDNSFRLPDVVFSAGVFLDGQITVDSNIDPTLIRASFVCEDLTQKDGFVSYDTRLDSQGMFRLDSLTHSTGTLRLWTDMPRTILLEVENVELSSDSVPFKYDFRGELRLIALTCKNAQGEAISDPFVWLAHDPFASSGSGEVVMLLVDRRTTSLEVGALRYSSLVVDITNNEDLQVVLPDGIPVTLDVNLDNVPEGETLVCEFRPGNGDTSVGIYRCRYLEFSPTEPSSLSLPVGEKYKLSFFLMSAAPDNKDRKLLHENSPYVAAVSVNLKFLRRIDQVKPMTIDLQRNAPQHFFAPQLILSAQ